MDQESKEKKEYQKPELTVYKNLNEITAGVVTSGPR